MIFYFPVLGTVVPILGSLVSKEGQRRVGLEDSMVQGATRPQRNLAALEVQVSPAIQK